jgi:hypothetical protein
MLSGPVLVDPGAQWWIFLTDVACGHRQDVLESLGQLDVHPIGAGSNVIMPGDAARAGSWSWFAPPRPGRPLPPAAAVVATAQRVGYRQRGRASTTVQDLFKAAL